MLDLLRPDANAQLTVRRSKEMKRSYVEGLSHHSVFSSKNAIRLLKEALQVRALVFRIVTFKEVTRVLSLMCLADIKVG